MEVFCENQTVRLVTTVHEFLVRPGGQRIQSDQYLFYPHSQYLNFMYKNISLISQLLTVYT